MKWFGKYKAIVTDIDDPEKRGRIRVQCPRVLDESKSPWCEPCIPVANDEYGDFCLPEVGETVWVEFEEGDSNLPIYTGGWYSMSKSPVKSSYLNNASKQRILMYKNVKIVMKKDLLSLNIGDKSIDLNGADLERLRYILDNYEKGEV